MPVKPKKPCAFSGCPTLTHDRYCPEHTKVETKNYNRYQRDPNHKKKYGSAWRRISKSYRERNPLCEICKADGRLVPAVLVHHKIKVADGGSNDVKNLQSLCQSCHEKIHRHERFKH